VTIGETEGQALLQMKDGMDRSQLLCISDLSFSAGDSLQFSG
jgi:hypothetical protein